MKADIPFLTFAGLCLLSASLYATPAVDKTPPVVSFTSPANNTRFTDSDITVTGKATDANGIDSVSFLFQSEVLSPDGTTDWSEDIELAPGTNNFWVWATDPTGNKSKAVMRSVFYVVPTTLSVGTDGEGTVSGVVDQQTVEIGRGYKAQAHAKAGWLFADWSDGDGNKLGTNATLSFVMQDNETITARFVTNLFTHIVGTYRGIYGAAPDNEDASTKPKAADDSSVIPGQAGAVVITTTKTGAFSGKLSLAATSYPISGDFYDDQDGTASTDIEIDRGDDPPLEVHLVIDTDPKTGMFGGSVSTDDWYSTLAGEKSKYVAAYAKPGRYNLGFGPVGDGSSAPRGFGYASAVVSKTGGVILNVTLPDSASVSSYTTALSKDGTCPFYLSRNGGKGLIIGWLSFTNGEVHGISVTWVRPSLSSQLYPDGFTVSPLPAFGALYMPTQGGTKGPFGWTTGLVTYEADSIGGEYANLVSYSKKSNTIMVTDDNPNQLSLTLTLSTGIFKGSFNSPADGSKKNFQGMIVPKSDFAPIPYGLGFFLLPNESGSVTMGPF